MNVSFRMILPDDLSVLRNWFEDAELSRRLSYPTYEWFAHVTNGTIARCWVASIEDRTVAMLQVDREVGDIGYFDLAVDPALRRRGLGVALLSAFVAGPGRAMRLWRGA